MIGLSKLHLPLNLLHMDFRIHLHLKAADHNLVLLGLLRFSKWKLLYPWSMVLDCPEVGVRLVLGGKGGGKEHPYGRKSM